MTQPTSMRWTSPVFTRNKAKYGALPRPHSPSEAPAHSQPTIDINSREEHRGSGPLHLESGMRSFVLAGFLIFAQSAHAAATQKAGWPTFVNSSLSTGSGHYCNDSKFEMTGIDGTIPGNTGKFLRQLYKNCHPGDTIMIADSESWTVPYICSFRNTIYQEPGSSSPQNSYTTICVLAPLRVDRQSN